MPGVSLSFPLIDGQLVTIFPAGSGKTVLSSTIIETIEQRSLDILAYFYFSIQREPVTLREFKCSLVTQLAKGLKRPVKGQPNWYNIPMSFKKLYMKYSPSKEPSMKDLDDVILDLLELSSEAYIVIDGLDECVPQSLRAEVVGLLGSLSQLDRGNTHILIASRREPDIEASISALPISKHVIELSVYKINQDIQQHLNTLMKTNPFKKWSPQLKEEVIEYLTRNANGVFRWADLQIQSLAVQEREKDIRKALKRLPKDLEATYERILKRIESEGKFEEAVAILRWLVFTTRPLTLMEAAEIAAFEVKDSNVLPESTDYSVAFSPGNRLLEPSSIQRILSGLVVVEDERYYRRYEMEVENWRFTDMTRAVSLAHSSVQDYLLSSTIAPQSFRLDSTNSQWFIFKSAIAYIAHYD
ncbi:hypothetical protein B0T17DRAFT_486546, partial [Bombardia bombarda]